MPINTLIGARGLRRQRQRADEFAREMYDPSVYAPQAAQAQRVATEGIDTDLQRRGVVSALFRSEPRSRAALFGGDQSRAISAAGAGDVARGQAFADADLKIMQADEGVRREGETALADIQSRQRQMGGMRDAALEQNRMMEEAEKSKRRGQLLSSVVGFGISAAGGAEAIGKSIGGLFGGGEVAEAVAGGGVGFDFSRPEAVRGLMNQGITDPAQMLDYLNYDEAGNAIGDFTDTEIESYMGDVMFGLGADPNIQTMQADPIDLADFGINEMTQFGRPEASQLTGRGRVAEALGTAPTVEPAPFEDTFLPEGDMSVLNERALMTMADAIPIDRPPTQTGEPMSFDEWAASGLMDAKMTAETAPFRAFNDLQMGSLDFARDVGQSVFDMKAYFPRRIKSLVDTKYQEYLRQFN